MEKRIWARPEKTEVAFAANDYVAACGDGGTTYLFECNAGRYQDSEDNRWKSWSGSVYLETNGEEGFQEGSDQYLSSYEACGTKHEASSTTDFLEG